jgi:hypothetical protein
VAETVEQIIAEIVADDQMSQTLKSAQRKVRKLGGDVDKLNESLTKQEKTALKAARADKMLAKEMKVAADKTKLLAGEQKKLAARTANATKGIEGLAQGMGIGALSGERLANVWLAAGATAGALIGAIGILAGKSLVTYVSKNIDAQRAVERLDKAQNRFLETLGKAIFAEEKGIKTLDSFAGKLDQMALAVKENDKEVRNFAEGIVDATHAVTTFYTAGIQLALLPITGFIDLLAKAGGGVLKFSLGVVETLAQLTKAVGVLPKEMQEVIGFTNGMQDSISGLTDLSDGLTVKLHKSMQATRDFGDDMAGAAKGTKDFSGAIQEAERELQETQGPIKTWADVATVQTARVRDGFFELNKEVSKLNEGFGILEQPAFSAADVGFATEGGFGAGRFGFAGLTAERLDPGADGVAEAAAELQAPVGLAQSETSLMNEEAVDLNASLNELASGGIANVTAGIGTYIEAMAAGQSQSVSFGAGLALSMGELMQSVGAGMIALSTAKLIADEGFINPLAGIAIGALLVATGAATAGFAKKSISRGKSSGASKAKAVAHDVADVITSRIGNGVFNQQQRQGDNVQVIIGERPIKDVVVQSVRQAISNREINTLSLAGSAL